MSVFFYKVWKIFSGIKAPMTENDWLILFVVNRMHNFSSIAKLPFLAMFFSVMTGEDSRVAL